MEEVYIFQGKEFTRTQLEEKYGDRVDEVIQNYGFQKKNSQEQPFSPLEEQAMSVASSEPSETVSESTDQFNEWGATQFYQGATGELGEPVKKEEVNAFDEKGLQKEEVDKGRKANYVLEEVGSLVEKLSDWEKDAEENPDAFAFTQPSQEDLARSEWGPTEFYQGSTGELGEPVRTREEERKKYAQDARVAFQDNQFDFTQYELEKAKPELDRLYQNLTGHEFEEMVIEQADGSLGIDPNALSETEFFSDAFQKAYQEEVEQQAQEYEDAWITTKTGAALGAGAENLYRSLQGYFDPSRTTFETTLNDAKIRGIKKTFGLSDEQIDDGVVKNIEKGEVGAALHNLTAGVLTNMPQMAVAVGANYAGMPNVGLAVLAASAGGSSYAEIADNPNIPNTLKPFIAGQSAAVEFGLEKMLNTDIRLGQQALRNLGSEGRRELARRVARNFIKEAKIPFIAAGEEGLEEGLASVNEIFLDGIANGDLSMDAYDVGDAFMIGVASGGNMGIFNIVTKAPSYIGSYKTANRRKALLERINELRAIQQNPNSTEQEVQIAEQAVNDARREVIRIGAEDQAIYDNMSEEDVLNVMSINRRIARNLDALEETDNKILQESLSDKLQRDYEAKKAIEEKYTEETTETQEEVAEEEVAEESPEEVAEEVVEEQVADTDSENILDAREKFNTVSERASRNEPINENEIDEAINEAYDALSELEGKDSQEAQIMQELIEDEIQKLEQYDNKTTTETRKIAEERTVRTVKKTPRKTVPSREKDFVGKKAVVADNKGGGVRGLVEIVETPDGREYYIVRSEGDTKTEVVGAKTDGKKTTRRVAKVNGFGEAFVLGETSKVFSEATVNFDKDGNPVSVTFPVGKDGKQVTVKSPEIAAEFELEQMKQQEYDEQVFEETFIEFTGEEQVEVRKPTPPRQTQEETDAVQEPATEEVDVRQQAEDGKEVGERDTKEQEPTQESKKKDKVISALDKAIEATSGKGKAMDATLAIPLSLANSALKIVKAAYIGGKSLAQAIKDGYDHITQNGGQVRASDWEEFVNEKIFEGEKKNTRETIDQNSSSLEQVFPFLQNFNPKHDYSQAQLNDINAFIDRYLEDGNDFASGKVEAIIEGVNGAYKEDNGKAGTRSLNNVDKWFSNVDQMFAAIFNRARNTYNVMVNSGYRGNKGLVEEKGKIDALKNDWISRFKAVYENLSVSDKSLLSEMKVMIAAYMEQAVNMNNQAKENEQLQESEVIERIREDFVHTIKEVRNNGDNDQRAEAADEALKIFNNVTSLEEALAILTKGQRDYLNALIEANNTFLDEKVKRARENGKRFSPLDRYIHIAIRGKKRKSTDPQPEDFADEIMESSSAIQIVSSFEFLPFSGGESGSKESGATKTRVLNRKPLADGEYYDLNFLTSQFRSFNNSNLAIFTYHSIIKMNAFFSQEGVVKKLFGGGNVGSQNISQIKNQVDFELNSDQIQAKANQDLYGKINYAAALGGAKKVAITATMFRILQPFKQSAVFMNTLFHAMIMNGGKGLIRAGTSASYILSDYVSNRRGEDSGSDITSAPYWGVMKKAPEAFRDLMESLDFIDNFDFQGAKKARDFYNRAFNASAKYTLTAWDRGVAQISFLILYEQSMRKQGLMKNVDVSSSEKYMEWWEEQSQNPNEVAIAEASSLVSKDQNASRPFQRSKLQTDESGAEKWVRTLGFPFMTFLTSKTNSLYQDGRIITTREKGKVTKEERKDASLRYAGTLAEVALFHGIGVWGGYYVRNFLASASELLFEGDDEEDKFKKDDWGKEASLWKKWWTNSVTDGIPFVNMAQPAKTAVAYGYNYSFWSLMNKTSEDFQEKYPTFDIFNGSDAAPAKAINFDKKWYDNLGYVGIAYANVQNAAILWYEGTQGEGFDAYGNKVFYTEDQADNLKLNAFLTTVGVFPLMFNADANFGSMYERMDAQRYSFDSKLARDLDAYVDDKDKALSVQEYLVEKAEELEQERGIMGLAGLARQMEYDLSEFTDRRILQTIFAVAQGKKSASEGKINEFLYNLSRRKSLPSRAVANQIKTRLDKLPEEEAKQLEKEFMIAGIDLFGENKWVEIIDIIDEYNKK